MAANFNGGRISFPDWTATAGFTVTGDFSVSTVGQQQSIIGDWNPSGDNIRIQADGGVRVTIDGSTRQINSVINAVGQLYSLSTVRTNTLQTTVSIDGASSASATRAGDVILNNFSGTGGGFNPFTGTLSGVWTLSNEDGSDPREYDFDAVSAGATTIPNTAVGALPNTDATVIGNVTLGAPPPAITITNGTVAGGVFDSVAVDSAYNPPAATALDATDGSIAVTIDTSALDITTAGFYPIVYTATNSSGVTDTVIVSQPVGWSQPPALNNPSFDSLNTAIIEQWNAQSIVNQDGIVLIDRSRIDAVNGGYYFNERNMLANAGKIANITRNKFWLDRFIAMAEDVLYFRDDNYAADGNTVFTGAQTGYRNAPPSIITTNTPAAVWSGDYTDTANANTGNVVREGRSAEVLINARVLSALAHGVLAYQNILPVGAYTPLPTARGTLLTGTYAQVFDDIAAAMVETLALYDGLHVEDVAAFNSFVSATPFNVEASYVAQMRQNINSSGIDPDNILIWNHQSGMYVADMVIDEYYPSLRAGGKTRFGKFRNFFFSLLDGTNTASGTFATSFGFYPSNNSYGWPYRLEESTFEDYDHTVVTLEMFEVGHILGVLERAQLNSLNRAVQTFYDADGVTIYDRMFTQSGATATSDQILIGSSNYFSDNTTLQTQFKTAVDNIKTASPVTLTRSEYDAVVAYYGSEQLQLVSVPTYYSSTLTEIPTDLVGTETFYEHALENSFTMQIGDEIRVTPDNLTMNGASRPNFGVGYTTGNYTVWRAGSQVFASPFGIINFVAPTLAEKFSGEKVFASKDLLDAMGTVTYSGLPQHDGASGAVLTDADRNFIEADLIGGTIYNQTDGSSGVITSATVNSITAPLSGGTNNTWNLGDEYLIFHPENGIFGSDSTQIQIRNLANLPTNLSEMHFRLYASHEAFSADQSDYPNELVQSTSSQASRNVADGNMVFFENSDFSDLRILSIRPNSNTTYFATAITDSGTVSAGTLLNSNAIDSDLTTSTGAEIAEFCMSFTQTETYTHANRVRQPALDLVTTGAWDETLCTTIRLGQTGGNGIGDFWIQGFELYDGVYEPELEEFPVSQGALSIGVLPDSFMRKNFPDVQSIDNQATISAEITREAAKNGYDVSYVNAAKNGFGWANTSSRIDSTDIDLIAAGNCSLALIWPTVNDLSATGWAPGITSIQDYTDALFPTLELLAQVPSIDNIIVCTQVPFLNSAASAGFGGTNTLSEFHYNDTQYIDAVNNVWLNLATDTRLSALFRSKCLPTIDLDQALTYSREHTIGSATAVPTVQNDDFHPSQLGNLALSSVLTPAVLEAGGVIEPSLPPVIAPSQTFTANENQAIGSSIGTLSVTPNGTISAVNTNSSLISIDPATLNITYAQVVTTVGSNIISATAVNENGTSTAVTFTLNITDVDETVTPTAQNFSLTMAVDDARNVAGGVLGQLVFTNLSTGEPILFTGTDGSMFSNNGADLQAVAPFAEGGFSADYTVTNVDPDGTFTQTATGTITLTVTAAAADTTPPVIAINGAVDGQTIQLLQGSSFTPLAATATDNVDVNVNVITTNNVDTANLGLQTVDYSATDAAGNTATATVNYNVYASGSVDLTPVLDAIATLSQQVADQDAEIAALQIAVGAIPTDQVDVSGLATQASVDLIPTDPIRDLTPAIDAVSVVDNKTDTIITNVGNIPTNTLTDDGPEAASIGFIGKRHTNRSVYLDELGNPANRYNSVREIIYDNDGVTVLQTITYVDSQGNPVPAYRSVGTL